jgi:hypothetical protein
MVIDFSRNFQVEGKDPKTMGNYAEGLLLLACLVRKGSRNQPNKPGTG